MILLDTNAIVWAVTSHRRGQRLRRESSVSISPASLLELGMLVSAGRIRVMTIRPLAVFSYASSSRSTATFSLL